MLSEALAVFRKYWHIIAIILISLASVLYFAWVSVKPLPGPPYLELQVSPPGYPQVGDTWKILVYKVNESTREYAKNATVIVEVLTETNTNESYKLPTNEIGQATFQYLPEHSEVSFQAFLEGYEASDIFRMNQRYVPESDITILFWVSSAASFGGAVATGKYIGGERKKSTYKKAVFWTSVVTWGLSSFVLLSTIYLFLFRSTFWGYPWEVVGPFVTTETLRYSTYVAGVLYLLDGFLLFLGYTTSGTRNQAS